MIEQEYIPVAIFGVIIVCALIIGFLKPSEPVVTKPTIKSSKKVAAITKDGKYVEGVSTDILYYKGRPVNIDLPNFIEAEITQCDPGVKGNTANGGSKPATISAGAVVQVPLFVEQGEWIKVDTRTKEYVSRVKK